MGVQDVEEAVWQGEREPGGGVGWTVDIQALLRLQLLWEQPEPPPSLILPLLLLTKITQRL